MSSAHASRRADAFGSSDIHRNPSFVLMPFCYDGVIVTCYNQVTRHGRKRKEKNILLFFLLFVEEDSFLPLEQRVELKIDLAGATTLWKNQDVT